MLSTPPIIYTTVYENGAFGHTLSTAQTLSLAPMLETQVQGTLSNSGDMDVFRLALAQGQILTADLSSTSLVRPIGIFRPGPPTTAGAPRLALLDSGGSVLDARQARNGQSLEFRVAESGNYFLEIGWSGPATSQEVPYTVKIRPIGLAHGSLDSSWLGRTGGGLYAWLDGNLLDISGPVGHGFGIRGNWTESVAYTGGLPGATYSAGGTVYLETPQGEVPMPLPTNDPMSVTTNPQPWGDAFGEVGSVEWAAPSTLASYEAVLAVLNPAALLPLVEIDASTKIGIKLGNDSTLQNTGAPLNAAIPYLYLSFNPLAGSSAGGVTQVFSVILDPADPFLYIGSPKSDSVFPITAVAVSQSGLIPYTPVDGPSQWSGSLRGQLYIQGTIDTTALTIVPSEIEGSLTLNLDPNHTGQWLGGSVTPMQLANLLLVPQDPATFLGDGQALDQLFHNFSAGLNGELNVSPWDKIQDIPGLSNRLGKATTYLSDILKMDVPRALTVAHASLVYDGPTESCYFRGGTTNPFAGTVAATFATPATVDVDAALRPGGEFYLDAKGEYNALGLTARGEVKVLNNWPATIITIGPFGMPGERTVYQTEVDAALSVNVLGAVALLHGQVQGNGDFDLTGSASLGIGGLSASANFDLLYLHTGRFSFTADAQAQYSDSVVAAALDLNFQIAVDPYGHLSYSGSGTASAEVNTWLFGWQSAGSVSVGIDNQEIWFSVDGYEVAIPLV